MLLGDRRWGSDWTGKAWLCVLGQRHHVRRYEVIAFLFFFFFFFLKRDRRPHGNIARRLNWRLFI